MAPRFCSATLCLAVVAFCCVAFMTMSGASLSMEAESDLELCEAKGPLLTGSQPLFAHPAFGRNQVRSRSESEEHWRRKRGRCSPTPDSRPERDRPSSSNGHDLGADSSCRKRRKRLTDRAWSRSRSPRRLRSRSVSCASFWQKDVVCTWCQKPIKPHHKRAKGYRVMHDCCYRDECAADNMFRRDGASGVQAYTITIYTRSRKGGLQCSPI